MAKFDAEIPNDLLKQFQELETKCSDIFGEMTQEGAKVVYKNVKANMRRAFNDTKKLEEGLFFSKVQKTADEDSIQTWIGFMGYVAGSKPTARHPYGMPIPLIAMAREYGTYGSNPKSKSNKKTKGEKKISFFRTSFKKKEIEQAMLKVQDKYLKGD